jgi:uncharacterized membrane protein
MILLLVVALLLGIVAGMRALMAPAIYFIARGPLWLGLTFAGLEVFELIGDALPITPSRTRPLMVVGRVLSGGIVGWFVGSAAGVPVQCAALGVTGALVGTYGGHALRIRAIAAIGSIPAALLEDAIAIVLGIVAVTR